MDLRSKLSPKGFLKAFGIMENHMGKQMETIWTAGFFNGLQGAYSWCVYLVTVLETPQSIGFTVKAGREENNLPLGPSVTTTLKNME